MEDRGQLEAKQAGIPFLGSLPIDHRLAEVCDKGAIEDYENNHAPDMASWVTGLESAM